MMKTSSIKVIRYKSGVYDGLWGGDTVEIVGTGLLFRVKDGVRTMDMPCTITIKNGSFAYVEEKTNVDPT